MAPTSHQPALGPKSSLLSHSFPSFYACYLLKSIQTPLSKATYIGSTPNPPRRIRQHNGEITAGAWKTKHKRPWVMHMIVYGFPSRLAALQFEWAWQHPHLSRHLRDDAGKALFVGDRKSKYLKMNIQIVRMMISNHPYITWPLHVKLFTEEAVTGWKDAAKTAGALPLPPGFTCSVELEGIDGRSGKLGSGRKGPINVKDETFTSAYLAKNTALLASNPKLNCSVCHEPLFKYAMEALSTALCPASTCTAVSHLSCLAQHFLKEQSTDTGLVPRGGTCRSCETYTLWGDVVRGCYRRSTDGSVPEDEEIPESERGAMSGSDVEQQAILSPTSSPHKKPGKRKPERALPATKKPRKKVLTMSHMSSEGELFDLDVSSTDEDNSTGLLPSKKQEKPHCKVVFPRIPQGGPSSKESSPGPPLPKKRARPRKVSLPETPEAGPSISKTPTKKAKVSDRTPAKNRTNSNHLQDSDTSGEFFDFGALSEATTSDDDAPTRRRGKVNQDPPVSLNFTSPQRGLTPSTRLRQNSPHAVRTPTSRARFSSVPKSHHQESTSKSPFKPFPQLEPLDSPGDTSTDSIETLPQAEDVLMRAMSSLSVSSLAPSPKPAGQRYCYKDEDVIEISD
ncbi:hypothetical protein BDZ94DRAFT_1032958 [Collybia nuda]|uniref:GIY-YIG domain-containing protein n=1 Tax=Collybia nuda TaxID=64659 RepID=A0A9P6CNV7_9AGAR|nr:hypothetical protein BDZ94DRAFT_1032958 [Collybia nuda]